MFANNTFRSYVFWLLAATFATSGPALFVLLMRQGVGKFEGLASFFFLGGILFFGLFRKDAIEMFKVFQAKKQLWCWLLLSACVDSAAFFIFVEALQGASVAEVYAVILGKPVFVLIWGKFLLKEQNRIRCWRTFALAFSCLIGGVLVLAVFYNITLATLALAVAASASMQLAAAVQIRMVSGHALKKGALVSWNMLGASVILTLISIIYRGEFTFPSFQSWGLILALGVGTVALPQVLRMKAISLSNYTRIGFLETLGPIIGIIWGVILLGEQKILLGSVQVALCFFFAGAVLAQVSLKKEEKSKT